MKTKITAIGHYLPNKITTNDDLERLFNIPAENIFKKTGILERRYSEKTVSNTELVYGSIQNLLKNSPSLDLNEIECLIVGTLTPDFFFPSTSVSVINKLGAKKMWGFDLSAACAGFCYGLNVAKAMIESGQIKNCLVVGSEKMTSTLNNFDYKTGILFGDGAGAVFLERCNDDEKFILKKTFCKVEADEMNDVYFKTPFIVDDWALEKFELDGQKVYKNGVKFTISTILQYLTENNLRLSDFNYFVPHQANMRMLVEIAKGLNLPIEKFLINIEKRGNTGGASIPICLSEFYQSSKIKKGDRLLLCSFGSGYTISIVDLYWNF